MEKKEIALQKIAAIKNATIVGENTAERVGDAMEAMMNAHEDYVTKEEFAAEVAEVASKVYPKISYIGGGTGLVYKDSNSADGLIPGHTYRIYVEDVNAVSNITGTSDKIRIIVADDNGNTLTYAHFATANYVMPEYYDVVMPNGYTKLYIEGRADLNKEVVFYVSDVTEAAALRLYTNDRLGDTEFPYTKCINSSDGSLAGNNNYVCTDYIEVIPNKVYRITSSGTGASSRLSVAFYNYDGNTYTMVGSIGANGGSVCYKMPSTANRVVISYAIVRGERYGKNGIVDVADYVREFGSFDFYSEKKDLWRNAVLENPEYYGTNHISNIYYYNVVGIEKITVAINSANTFNVVVGYYDENFVYLGKDTKTSGSDFEIRANAVYIKISLSKMVNGSAVATSEDDVEFGMISITMSASQDSDLKGIIESLGNDTNIAEESLLKMYQNFSPLSESTIFTLTDKAVQFANGVETAKTGYSTTDYIFLKSGVSITYNAYVSNSNYASFAVYNAAKTYVKALSVANDITQTKKVFVAPYDCYVRLSADSRFNVYPAYFRFTYYKENLPERLTNDETKIAQLENTAYEGNLPTYWQTYLAGKEAEIKTAIETVGNHGDLFIFFSDYHYRNNTRHTPDIIRKLYNRLGHLKVFNGGDILNTHNTTGEASNMLEDFVESFHDIGLLNIYGNHDGNPYASDAANQLTIDYWYNILFRDLERKYDVSTTNKGYYYIDNQTQKMRYIVLNTYDNGLWNNTPEHVEQLDWFCGVLNSVQNGWYVVVLTHMFYEIYSDSEGNKYIAKQTGALISKITDAYQSKTAGSYSRQGDTYMFDFTNAHGKMAAILCGHVHYDYSEQLAAGYPVISIIQDGINYPSSMAGNPTRTEGTYTEQAMDIVCIDTTNKVIKTVRIGVGANRNFTFT